MKKYEVALKEYFIVELHIELAIDTENISFEGELLAWSNDEQKYVKLEKSVYGETLSKKEYEKFTLYYTKLMSNYLKHLKRTLKTQQGLQDYIAKLEYPDIDYNYKLINAFGYDRLDKFVRKHLNIYPTFEKNTLELISQEVNGWYVDMIEVSTDLTNDDSVLIEDLSYGGDEIDVEEFFKRVKC